MNANSFIKVSAYGKCVVADYNSVHKDMCVQEFMRLKNCYLVSRQSVPPADRTNVHYRWLLGNHESVVGRRRGMHEIH